MLRRLLFAMLPALWIAPVGAETITFNGGGYLMEFAATAARYASQREPVRIEGECYSACTMFLSVPDTCVGPKASLWFHAPKPDNEWGRMFMTGHYPPAVNEWIVASGGLGPDWIILEGEELRDLVPRCGDSR